MTMDPYLLGRAAWRASQRTIVENWEDLPLQVREHWIVIGIATANCVLEMMMPESPPGEWLETIERCPVYEWAPDPKVPGKRISPSPEHIIYRELRKCVLKQPENLNADQSN